MSEKFLVVPVMAVVASIAFFTFAKPAHAISIEDIITGAKMFILGEDKKDLTIDSKIGLAPDGDVDKNGQIDAGDIVRFTYTITNTTDKQYAYATLKTNVNRKQLNFIHKLKGATGLSDKGDTIDFKNIRINSGEQRIISFDARVNYFRNDVNLSTEPEFVSSEKKSVKKFERKSTLAKKLSSDKVKARFKDRQLIIKKINNK